MRSKKRITHVDVAKHAGVSTAVVSYVINDGPRPTSPDVRERVMRAIRDLDYHPNAVARGLRARRTNTIGFVVDDYHSLDVFVSPYSARILTGLTAQLKARGYYLLLYPLDIGEDMSDIELLLRSGRLDGIVLRSNTELNALKGNSAVTARSQSLGRGPSALTLAPGCRLPPSSRTRPKGP